MSCTVKLFDTNGHLLPQENSTIKPLDTVTKYRAKGHSRRSPTRKPFEAQVHESELPRFVQEVTPNSHEINIRLASPSPVNGTTIARERFQLQVNTIDGVGNNLIRSQSENILKKNSIKSEPYQSHEKGYIMEGDDVNEAVSNFKSTQVSTWTSEDVATWLDKINLSQFKEKFLSQRLDGNALLKVDYQTLEKLNLSESSKEREHFLAELYNLKEKSHFVEGEEQMMNKDYKNTLPESNNEPTHLQMNFANGHTELKQESVNSKSSSSSTANTSKQVGQKQIVDYSSSSTKDNFAQRNINSNGQNSLAKNKTKVSVKKTKSKGKKISRIFNSKDHKDPSLLITPPPIYKNAFHNLMNTGPQGVIKIWTEMFLSDMQYVSLLVKHESNVEEVIKMVLEKSNKQERWENYCICEINEKRDEYFLDNNECPLQRERQWRDPDHCRFELRWKNERLIEWKNSSTSIAQDIVNEQDLSHQTNENTGQQDLAVSPLSSSSTSDGSSPQSTEVLETKFAYVVDVEPSKGSDEKKDFSSNITIEARNHEIEKTDFVDSALVRHVSSCPDLSQKDLLKNEESQNYGNLMVSKNFGLLNSEDNLAEIGGLSTMNTTNLDSSNEDLEENANNEEFNYSQQLRRSSKRLSDRLRLQNKPRIEGKAVEISVNEEQSETKKENVDVVNSESFNVESSLSMNIPLDLQSEVCVDLSSSKSEPDDVEINKNKIVADSRVEMKVMLEQISELQDENIQLAEENRELKKQSRTFEGKSRLKQRELEEMIAEKNDLANQVHDMVTELHELRATNAELHKEISEANTKLNDIDGWVTRDVFEDIRGQLSLSEEKCDKKEEEIREIEKKCKVLEAENKKMLDLQTEVENLNIKIKEDNEGLKEVKRDVWRKEKRISELETVSNKFENSLKEKDDEKQEMRSKMEETEAEIERLKMNHVIEKNNFKKNISDKEYEILIMKEEKKELCIKMNGFEGNMEALREEMKKKENEHKAIIAEMEKQSAIKDESLSVMVSNLEQLVTERDTRIQQLKKQIAPSNAPESELLAKEHEYEQNKVYLKHLITLVRERDPSILDALNKKLSSRDAEDWC